MADHRLTIRFRFDWSDMVRQLREAADTLEALEPQAEPEPAAEQAEGSTEEG